MAQVKRKRKKRRLHPRYVLRRILVAAVSLAVIGVGIWFVASRLEFLPTGEAEDKIEEPLPEGEQVLSPYPGGNEEQEEEPTLPEIPRADEEWNLILVNSAEPLPEGFEVELEQVLDFRVDTRIAEPLKRMFAKAKEDGISLMLNSAYRTVELQETNFAAKVAEYVAAGYSEEEATATTATIIAWPGTSEHHTGLALDIVTPEYQVLDEGFAETAAFRWLQENAEEFGFVLRFPADKENITKIIYEPWHYRYVGPDHARIMNENSYCLEEYVYVMREERDNILDRLGMTYEDLIKSEGSEEGEEAQSNPPPQEPAAPPSAQEALQQPEDDSEGAEDPADIEEQAENEDGGTLYNDGGAAIDVDDD